MEKKLSLSSILPDPQSAPQKVSESLAAQVMQSQAMAMQKIVTASYLSCFLASCVIAAIMIQVAPVHEILMWLLLRAGVTLLRLLFLAHENALNQAQRHPARSLRNNKIWAVVNGVAFGMIALWIENIELHIEYGLVVLMCCGICAVAVSSAIAYARSAIVFSVAMILPIGLKLAMIGEKNSLFFVVNCILLVIFVVLAARRAESIFVESVRVRMQAEALAKALETANRDLTYQANHDSLTGLLNRGAFHDELATAAYSMEGSGSRMGLLMIDLDRFKAVNDTLGHGAGDELIRQVAQRLRTTLEGKDSVISRLGGDEFAVLMPFDDDPSPIGRMGTELIARLSQPYPIHGHSVDIGASIGIELFRRGCQNPDALLSRADAALYAAKRAGRGRWAMDTSGDRTAAVQLVSSPARKPKMDKASS